MLPIKNKKKEQQRKGKTEKVESRRDPKTATKRKQRNQTRVELRRLKCNILTVKCDYVCRVCVAKRKIFAYFSIHHHYSSVGALA